MDDLPPHEARGPIGQLGDAGGGIVPALTPTPLPGALATSSPGVGAGVLAPAAGPTTPQVEDPGSMALMIAKLAGQMFGSSFPSAFGGASVPPVPMAPQPAATAATTTQPPAGQGITPTLSPAPPIAPEAVMAAPGGDPAPPPVPGAHVVPASAPASSAPATPFGPELPNFDLALLGPAVMPSFGGAPPGFETFSIPMLDVEPPANEPAIPGLSFAHLDSQQHDPRIDPRIGPRIDPRIGPRIGPEVRDLGGNAFDPHAARRDFPILEERVHGKRLVWLDNAATTQKPRAVIDRLSYFYEHENSNIHRAAHTLAARATDAYEAARESSRRFLNAPSTAEIIFVRGTTEGINLIAQSWGRRNVGAGDEIVLTHLEHHANIVPWQQLAAETGARLRIAPVDDRGDVILDAYEKLLGPRTKLVAFTQVSNALGTVTPAREMIAMARRHGAKVMLDGAQAVSHLRVDVQALDPDFYVFSGHKVFAPTGIGVVWGKKEILEAMPPWQGGGNMIQDVTFEKTTYQPPPFRFEAGTGNIADAVGLGAALDYVMRIGMDTIGRYEHELLDYATARLATVAGLTMVGTAVEKAGVLSFVLDGQRTEDVGAALDKEGIAVRSGHHCAQPILRRFGYEATVRASLAFYNVREDIDALVDALRRIQAGGPIRA